MTDPMELVGRLEKLSTLGPGWYANVGKRTGEQCCAAMSEAAACIREMVEWRPIETHQSTAIKGAFSPFVFCGHSEKKWIRVGRYDLSLKRWLYSGTNERSQYAQVEGDEPTHWLPLPPAPGAEA